MARTHPESTGQIVLDRQASPLGTALDIVDSYLVPLGFLVPLSASNSPLSIEVMGVMLINMMFSPPDAPRVVSVQPMD